MPCTAEWPERESVSQRFVSLPLHLKCQFSLASAHIAAIFIVYFLKHSQWLPKSAHRHRHRHRHHRPLKDQRQWLETTGEEVVNTRELPSHVHHHHLPKSKSSPSMTMPPPCERPPQEGADEETRRWSVIWRLMVSALYHQKRERFLDGADRLAQNQVSIPAAIVAIVGTCSLCYGPSAKARKHNDLARRFKALHADVLNCQEDFSEAIAKRFEAQILLIEAEEPAALGALVRQCENELSTAIGRSQDVRPISLWQRCFANIFDFDMSDRPPVKDDRTHSV